MRNNLASLFVVCLAVLDYVHAEECKPMSFQKLCMKDQGSTVVLENEKISMTINKAKVNIINLHYNSKKEPNKHSVNLLQGGSGYYLANINVNGKGGEAGPSNPKMKVVANTESHIDLAFQQTDYKYWPVDFEIHLVLEKGSSMFYYYSIHRYHQDGYSAGQLRWAFRTNEQVFKYFNVDGKRAGPFPTKHMMEGASTVQDATYRLKDGSVYTKYQHISDNEGVSSVFGIYDDHLGFSLIQPNKEWGRGGPFKQDLTTHGPGSPMLLFHEHSGHYGTPELVVKKGWNKVYGPVAFYLNEGDSPAAMYKDAERQLLEEEKKWPYKFVTAPEYDANGRGTVSGTLKTTDGSKFEWAYIILTEPHVEDPQFETATYMYATKAGPDGKFVIPAVRPGTYKLQVIAKGVVGKYIQNNIHVTAKHNTDLSTVNWKPDSHGHILWQIGVPDRSSAEFHAPAGSPSPIPHLDEIRKFGTWLSYSKDYPHDVDFTVGKSSPAKDWCFFMPTVHTPGYAAHLKEAGIKENLNATNWKVRFEYKGAGKGQATLTLGIAGEVRAGIRVVMNGHQIFKLQYLEGPNDSSLYRSAPHGIFHQYNVTFSESLLKKGENLMELTPPGVGGPTHTDMMLMWDFLRLEAQD